MKTQSNNYHFRLYMKHIITMAFKRVLSQYTRSGSMCIKMQLLHFVYKFYLFAWKYLRN